MKGICTVCDENEPKTQRLVLYPKYKTRAEASLSVMCLNLMVPPTSFKESMMVLIDGYSRFVGLHHCRDCTGGSLLFAIRQLLLRYGLPKMLIHDRPSAFLPDVFERFLADNSVQIKIAP